MSGAYKSGVPQPHFPALGAPHSLPMGGAWWGAAPEAKGEMGGDRVHFCTGSQRVSLRPPGERTGESAHPHRGGVLGPQPSASPPAPGRQGSAPPRPSVQNHRQGLKVNPVGAESLVHPQSLREASPDPFPGDQHGPRRVRAPSHEVAPRSGGTCRQAPLLHRRLQTWGLLGPPSAKGPGVLLWSRFVGKPRPGAQRSGPCSVPPASPLPSSLQTPCPCPPCHPVPAPSSPSAPSSGFCDLHCPCAATTPCALLPISAVSVAGVLIRTRQARALSPRAGPVHPLWGGRWLLSQGWTRRRGLPWPPGS